VRACRSYRRLCVPFLHHVGRLGWDSKIPTIEAIGKDAAGQKIQESLARPGSPAIALCQSGQIMSAWRCLRAGRSRRMPISIDRDVGQYLPRREPMSVSAKRIKQAEQPGG